jgi:creatinine amidohydrolase
VSAPDARRVRLSELTRDEATSIAEAGGVVLIPIAATEQHGPHLPAGTDAITVDHVATSAAARVADRVPVVVAPTLPFGCSAHHIPLGATASLSEETMLGVLLDLGGALAASGFRRLFYVNGHGGNHHLMHAVVQRLTLAEDVTAAAASWWQLAEDELVNRGTLERGDMPGHAGSFETSIMLALNDGLVRTPLPDRPQSGPGSVGLRAPITIRDARTWTEIDGYTDNPSTADRSAGAEYLEIAIASLATAIEELAKR